MILEREVLPYFQWLLQLDDSRWGLLWWYLIVLAVAGLLAVIVGYLVAAIRHGPKRGGDRTYSVVANGVRELPRISFRRLWALTRLAIQEALRRRVWVALIVFALILLFAGWFLDRSTREPMKLYVSFVLTATNFLVLVLALFLSAFSLPADIKNRTLHTVVTKPVRAGEIVLGRILGFTLLGTAMLVVMGLCSYFFVVRAVSHSHTLTAADMQEVSDDEGNVIGYTGLTSRDLFHEHAVSIDVDQDVTRTETEMDHWHPVTREDDGGETVYRVGPAQGLLEARIPHLGKLHFTNRQGEVKERGISVGKEWGYRSYIQGSSLASAIWTFDDVDEEDYPNGLLLDLTVRVFRSYKGEFVDEETQEAIGILGSLTVRNPETGLTSPPMPFYAKDAESDLHRIPRKIPVTTTNDEGEKVVQNLDLYDDFVENGRVQIILKCLDKAQFFGVAQADLHIRVPGGGTFFMNFFKGFLGIWVQMVIVISLGVMFSTFLSGPVAMLAILTAVLFGFYGDFIYRVSVGEIEGGGPVESLYRVGTQMNQTSELSEGTGTTVIQTLDTPMKAIMRLASNLLPDFRRFYNLDFRFAATGYDIPGNVVAQNLTIALAYGLFAFIAGYFLLRIREVAN